MSKALQISRLQQGKASFQVKNNSNCHQLVRNTQKKEAFLIKGSITNTPPHLSGSKYTCGLVETVDQKKGIFCFPLFPSQKQLVTGNKESHMPSYSKAGEMGARWGREEPQESVSGGNLKKKPGCPMIVGKINILTVDFQAQILSSLPVLHCPFKCLRELGGQKTKQHLLSTQNAFSTLLNIFTL